MCGEDYFHKEWPSSPPSGDGEPIEHEGWERSEAAPWNRNQSDELEEAWEDDLPDFGDPEEDDDWDEGEWFGDGEDYYALTLEDMIEMMSEEELLEWLTEEEGWKEWGRDTTDWLDEEAA